MPKKYKKIAEEIVVSNSRLVYKHDKIILVEKGESDYFYGDTPGSVIIVPILDDGRIALVRQYRYLRDKLSVELPRGGIKRGETALQSAQRELREETGIESSNFSKIGEFEGHNSFLKNCASVFLADEIFKISEQKLDEDEDMEVILRRPDEIDVMIKNGEIWDGQTLAAWALVHGLIVSRK